MIRVPISHDKGAGSCCSGICVRAWACVGGRVWVRGWVVCVGMCVCLCVCGWVGGRVVCVCGCVHLLSMCVCLRINVCVRAHVCARGHVHVRACVCARILQLQDLGNDSLLRPLHTKHLPRAVRVLEYPDLPLRYDSKSGASADARKSWRKKYLRWLC